ncbi:MAG: uroporphyrinogen-III synthase [Rhodoferax sp.]
MRVLVTRPESQAAPWVDALRRAGHEAVALPLICIGPAQDAAAVRQAWDRLAQYDAVMFVSASAIDHFFLLQPAQSPVFNDQSACKARAYVTGGGSLAALLRYGVQASWVDAPDAQATQFDSEALWAVVRARVQAPFRLLIVRGAVAAGGDEASGAGRDWLAEQVRQAGGEVDFVVAYRRCAPTWDAQQQALVAAAAQDGSVWLFSSSQAIDNLCLALPGQGWQQARALVTHPRIAKAAQKAGFGVVCESRPMLADLVASIESIR